MTQFSDLLRIGAAIVPELASTNTSSPEDTGDPQPVLNVQRFGAVTTLVASGIFSGTATSAGANDLTLNGTLVTAGVAVLDVARAPVLTATSNLSTLTFGAYGTNLFGQTISRTGVAGPNATSVTFDKSFKTITRFTRSGPVTTTLKIGNSYTLGVNRRLKTADQICGATVDGKNISAAGMPTITVGLASGVASTATNGDPRGLILFASGAQPNSSRRLTVVIDSTGLQNSHDYLVGATQ